MQRSDKPRLVGKVDCPVVYGSRQGGESAVDADATRPVQCDRYREIAKEIHLLVSKMKHAEAAEELRLLAVSYEGLAEHAEATAGFPRLGPADFRGLYPR